MPGPKVWPLSIGNSIYAEGVSGTPTGIWSAAAVSPTLSTPATKSSSHVSGYSTMLAVSRKAQDPTSNVPTTPVMTSKAAPETTLTPKPSSQTAEIDCETVTVNKTTIVTVSESSSISMASACVPDAVTTTATATVRVFATDN